MQCYGPHSAEAPTSVELLNPAGLPVPDVYAQVAVARGTRTVYLAGQVARTADGAPVGGGDLAAQTEQAFLNVATALAGAGATFDDVARAAPDPRSAVLDFYEAAYVAGATRAGWDVAGLACVDGSTDPLRRADR